MSSTCLNNIVGLDRAVCPCFETDRPVDYNTSTSGYYLTDPEYGVPMRDGVLASADCSEGSIWDVLTKARTLSILDLQVDLKAALDTRKRSAFNPWSGVIGKASANRSVAITKQYAGRVIKPVLRKRHQKKVLTALYLGIDFSGSVDVILNSNAFGFTRKIETVTAISGRFVKHTLSTPWVLDLYSAEEPDLYYTIAFEHGGNTVLDNKIWCCSTPGWMKSIIDFGYTDDEETRDFSETKASNTTGNGLAFEAYITCDEMQWICELDKLGGKQMKSLLGRAVQYKAAVKVLSQMLESGNINQFSLLNAEAGFQKMAHSQERYNEILTWIAQELPSGFSGCFTCNDDTTKVHSLIV